MANEQQAYADATLALVKRFELALERFHGAYADPYADAEDRGDAKRTLTDARNALLTAFEASQNDAYAEGRKDQEQHDAAASLIDAWIALNGRPIPWAKAVEITAIVHKMSDAERLRLLALD